MIRRLLKKIYTKIRTTASTESQQREPSVFVAKETPQTDVPLPREEEYQEAESEVDVEVESKDVLQWIEEGKKPILLDIRQPYELRSGFIPHAYLISMNQLATQVELFPKDVPIVLYCAAGARSFGMAHFMREKGFSDAWSLSGGVGDWHSHEHHASSAQYSLLQEVSFEEGRWIIWGATQENERILYRLRKNDTLEIREHIEESMISQ